MTGGELVAPGGGSPQAEARNMDVLLYLATALLILVAFCAIAATGAELIAAGRANRDSPTRGNGSTSPRR